MTQRWYEEYLVCPDCTRPLRLTAACACGFTVPEGLPLDLRPQKPRRVQLDFPIGSSPASGLEDCLVERPRVTYRGPRAERDSTELVSAAEPWLRPGAKLLDLGCGPRDQAVVAAHYGVQYVGLDYSSKRADLLADAHTTPFADATFDVVLSYAVLEHLYNPFAALHELARILKPGGVFVGTVSQGEPFHDSYFHHTAFGVMSVFTAAGLRPLRLWPSYDTLHALSTMGRYPRIQRLMIEAVYRIGRRVPILAPRKYFRWTPREKAVDELHRAASICFLAEKTVERPVAI